MAKKSKDSFPHVGPIIVGVLLIGFVFFGIMGHWLSGGKSYYHGKVGTKATAEQSAVNTSEPQAVFLSNGQVYFGEMTAVNSEFIILEDVFYLQQDDVTVSEGEEAVDPGLSLIRLGEGEIHSPDDTLVINKDQVLFWENLLPGSEVAEAMESYDDVVAAEPVVVEDDAEETDE